MLDSIGYDLVTVAVFADITIAALAFWFWMSQEAPRAGVRNWGWLIPATLFIGLCFAFPMFMFLRERAMEARAG
jgi:hypothetical protein